MAGDSGAGDEWVSLIRGLKREEILEVLSDGFCEHCQSVLQTRIHNLLSKKCSNMSVSDDNSTKSSLGFWSTDTSNTSLESSKRRPSWGSMQTPESVYLGNLKGGSVNLSPASMNGKQSPSNHLGFTSSLNVEPPEVSPVVKGLSEEQKERIEFAQVERKKNFVHIERVNGKERNILQGLELHTLVFNADEQKKIVDCVYDLQRMGQKGQLRGSSANLSLASMNGKHSPSNHLGFTSSLNVGPPKVFPVVDKGLSEEQKEHIEFAQVGRKKNFVHIERVNGKERNIVQGLELHTRVFNVDKQKKIVDCVYDLQLMGHIGQLRERTYSEPAKWMRGKGRVTIQFGCCYNYSVDKYGNPPGIIRDEEVDPLPPLFKQMIKKMVRWHVLPPTCIPNSCIVNIYEADDCIPPHIDHHDFLRPFCTVSFLTECNILFGLNLKIVGPGEFAGPSAIPLPVGSVLILNGNGADVAKHCIPAVPARRISITFRKMDDNKLPYKFSTDPELQGIRPLLYNPLNKSPVQQKQHEHKIITPQLAPERTTATFLVEKDDFPPLGGSTSSNQQRSKPVTKIPKP